ITVSFPVLPQHEREAVTIVAADEPAEVVRARDFDLMRLQYRVKGFEMKLFGISQRTVEIEDDRSNCHRFDIRHLGPVMAKMRQARRSAEDREPLPSSRERRSAGGMVHDEGSPARLAMPLSLLDRPTPGSRAAASSSRIQVWARRLRPLVAA